MTRTLHPLCLPIALAWLCVAVSSLYHLFSLLLFLLHFIIDNFFIIFFYFTTTNKTNYNIIIMLRLYNVITFYYYYGLFIALTKFIDLIYKLCRVGTDTRGH